VFHTTVITAASWTTTRGGSITDCGWRKTISIRIDELLDLSIHIAEGLEAVHCKASHRDIKPANIFTTTRGHARFWTWDS